MQQSPFSEGYRFFLGLLRTVRRETGITQIQLADALGVTQSFVSKCERGERRLDIVELRAWCHALGIPLDDFVSRLQRILDSGEAV